MASQKRSISFDESVLHEAEQRLAGSGGSLSERVADTDDDELEYDEASTAKLFDGLLERAPSEA